MKKFFATALSIILLGAFLSSCSDSNKSVNSETSGETESTDTTPAIITETIDLSEYSIVMSEYNYYSLLNYVNNFKALILEYTGVEIDIEIDEQKEISPDSKEILIGNTNREESQTALSNLSDRTSYLICAD